ncbi:MAG: UDP-N-acetylglucosamine 1-carboxyvinyltransferase [Candidatus Gracilibacteria bacterium]|nr:UDP-N-acetylglucosamine 1-carboxyvinyltransferase [Candidatus Gracilibacteria bacterium]
MYKINNSRDLVGEVLISGSKNAALPVLAATLLVRGKIKLNNVPRIGDVMTFLEIISTIGAVYKFDGNTLYLDTSHLDISNMNLEMIKKIRASILLLSPILHYFGNISIPSPGGCSIGKRPIDAHLNGLKAIGYDYEFDGKNINITGKPLSGDVVLCAFFGVTSTENLIVANVLRNGTTTIELSAIEPHVMNLIDFLRIAGADIKIRYNHTIIINGVENLKKEVECDIVSDYIESGTFMVLASLTSKDYIDIKNARFDDLYAFIEKLRQAGIKIENLGNDTARVYRCDNLKRVDIQTNIFPGFPTDIQSPFSILMTQADGISKIHEILFEGRLNFLVELDKMRGHTAILNPHEAMIFGKTELKGATVTSWDLRAGAAMVIAGLIAEGETKVTNIEYIERGYENFVGKLKKLGAKIEVVKE